MNAVVASYPGALQEPGYEANAVVGKVILPDIQKYMVKCASAII